VVFKDCVPTGEDVLLLVSILSKVNSLLVNTKVLNPPIMSKPIFLSIKLKDISIGNSKYSRFCIKFPCSIFVSSSVGDKGSNKACSSSITGTGVSSSTISVGSKSTKLSLNPSASISSS